MSLCRIVKSVAVNHLLVGLILIGSFCFTSFAATFTDSGENFDKFLPYPGRSPYVRVIRNNPVDYNSDTGRLKVDMNANLDPKNAPVGEYIFGVWDLGSIVGAGEVLTEAVMHAFCWHSNIHEFIKLEQSSDNVHYSPIPLQIEYTFVTKSPNNDWKTYLGRVTGFSPDTRYVRLTMMVREGYQCWATEFGDITFTSSNWPGHRTFSDHADDFSWITPGKDNSIMRIDRSIVANHNNDYSRWKVADGSPVGTYEAAIWDLSKFMAEGEFLEGAEMTVYLYNDLSPEKFFTITQSKDNITYNPVGFDVTQTGFHYSGWREFVIRLTDLNSDSRFIKVAFTVRNSGLAYQNQLGKIVFKFNS